MRVRVLLFAAAGLLGACATPLTSTLVAPPPPGVAAVGAPLPVWPAAQAAAEYAAFGAEVSRRITREGLAVPVQLTQVGDGTLRARLGVEESFAPGSAQLLASALSTYAELAAAIVARPGVVTHVLVHGEASEVDPSADLTARRAASIVHYLATRGVAGARLRGEGRGTSEPLTLVAADRALNARVELVFKPVVAGREADAWVPPAPVEPCEPCGEE